MMIVMIKVFGNQLQNFERGFGDDDDKGINIVIVITSIINDCNNKGDGNDMI